jgi:hypothetical protein
VGWVVDMKREGVGQVFVLRKVSIHWALESPVAIPPSSTSPAGSYLRVKAAHFDVEASMDGKAWDVVARVRHNVSQGYWDQADRESIVVGGGSTGFVSDPMDPDAGVPSDQHRAEDTEVLARFVRVRLLEPAATRVPVAEAMGKGVVYSMSVQVHGCPVRAATASLGASVNVTEAVQRVATSNSLTGESASVAEHWVRSLVRHSAGASDVSGALDVVPPMLRTGGDNSSIASLSRPAFIYSEAASATVASVSPNRGSTAGGTLLTIAGTGFGSAVRGVQVMVGTVPCVVTEVAPLLLKCVTGTTNVQNGGAHLIQVPRHASCSVNQCAVRRRVHHSPPLCCVLHLSAPVTLAGCGGCALLSNKIFSLLSRTGVCGG